MAKRKSHKKSRRAQREGRQPSAVEMAARHADDRVEGGSAAATPMRAPGDLANRVLGSDGDHGHLLLWAAAGQLQAGDLDTARGLTRQALQGGADSRAAARLLLGSAYVQLGRASLLGDRPAQAMRQLRVGLELGVPGGAALCTDLLMGEAERCGRHGYHREAEQRWRAIAELLGPKTPKAVQARLSDARSGRDQRRGGVREEQHLAGDRQEHEVRRVSQAGLKPVLYLDVCIDPGLRLPQIIKGGPQKHPFFAEHPEWYELNGSREATAGTASNQAEPSLTQAQATWDIGDWPALVALDKATLVKHPHRAALASYIAAGYQQQGDLDATNRCRELALDWGADKDQLRRLLYSGAYNMLGRACAAALKYDRAYQNFSRALALMNSQPNHLEARIRRQLADIPGLEVDEILAAILATAAQAQASSASQQTAKARSQEHEGPRNHVPSGR